MPAERRRAAALDGIHDLQLLEADMAAVGVTPSGTVVAEDIRDLQSGTHAERRAAMPAASLVASPEGLTDRARS